MPDTSQDAVEELSQTESTAIAVRPGARFPHIDSMRAIAALSVVLFHTGVIGGITGAGALAPYVLHLNVGVCLFFVISGFLLYRPFVAARLIGAKPVRLGPYLTRRALRILPGYWFALTVLTIAFHLPGVFSGDWWRYYGLVQIYDPHTIDQGMGVAWTLCIEATFYLFLPAVDQLVGRLTARLPQRQVEARDPETGQPETGTARPDVIVLATLSAVSLIFVFSMYLAGVDGWATLNLLGTFDWFALGMAVALLTVARPHFRYWHPVVFWTAALALFIGVSRMDGLSSHTRLFYPLQHVGYGLIAVLLFMPAAINHAGAIGRLLSWRALTWTGLISYSIYLFHASLIPPLRNRSAGTLVPGNDWVSLTIITLIVVLPVAAVSYYLVESRSPALIRRAVSKITG